MEEFNEQEFIELCQEITRIPSETPPGDTRELAHHVYSMFIKRGLPAKMIAPVKEMPNVVCTIEGKRPGKHLVFNGHLDVYPANDHSDWQHPPYKAIIEDGKLYGRGIADMKTGVASSIYAFFILAENRDWSGKLSITLVSDEQNGGKWGTEYLLRNYPELRGDALLNGEPSACPMVSIGEKGTYWIRLNSENVGGHGAYAHEGNSAIHDLIHCLNDLRTYETLRAEMPADVKEALKNTKPVFEELRGKDSFEAVMQYTVNVGIIQGGTNVNTQATTATAEVDFRIPPGGEMKEATSFIHKIIEKHPNVTFEVMKTTEPTLSSPSNALLKAVKQNAEEIRNEQTVICFTFGATDARYWRLYDVPAAVYGPNHHNMGSADEFVYVEDIITVGKVHLAASYDYLCND